MRAFRLAVGAMLATALTCGVATAQSSQQWWSTVASVGQESDAASINRGANGPYVELNASATSALLRYPITPADGIAAASANGGCWAIRAHYRDTAPAPARRGSSEQRVYITVNYLDLNTGDTGDIGHFDSDDFANAPGYQTQTSQGWSQAFDFQNYVYWAEARLSRRTGHASGAPALGAFQIVAAAACPPP